MATVVEYLAATVSRENISVLARETQMCRRGRACEPSRPCPRRGTVPRHGPPVSWLAGLMIPLCTPPGSPHGWDPTSSVVGFHACRRRRFQNGRLHALQPSATCWHGVAWREPPRPPPTSLRRQWLCVEEQGHHHARVTAPSWLCGENVSRPFSPLRRCPAPLPPPLGPWRQ